MQYELYYSTGGHGGPYPSAFAAKLAALTALSGNINESHIDIKTRSINSVEVARITREDFWMFVEKFGKLKPPPIEKINMAQFEVKTVVTLYDVGDVALENSEVLHSDVLEKLKYSFEAWDFEITLDEVFLIDKIKD